MWGQDPTTAQPVLLVKGALTYIATSNKARNANYLGPAAIEDIAKQVNTLLLPHQLDMYTHVRVCCMHVRT